MKRRIIKIIILAVVILTFACNITVFADTILQPTDNPDFYKPSLNNTNSETLTKKVGKILGVINAVGVVVSVIVLGLIGIKYMFGSVEEKAEYKKTMIGYIIGAILVFSATTLPNVLYRFGSSIGEETTSSGGGGGGSSNLEQTLHD